MKHFPTVLTLILLAWVTSGCQPESIEPEPEAVTPIERFAVLEDNVGGTDVVIAGNKALNLMVSYERRLLDGTVLQFRSTSEKLPLLLTDQEGNSWDVFGRAVDGPRTGQRLRPTYSMMSYWFAIAAMYPGMEIYGIGPSSPSLNLSTDPDWDISLDNVEWGSAWNAIPAIDAPTFINYSQREFLGGFFVAPADLVIGTEVNGDVRAYPHGILNYHEIVNDVVGGQPLTVAWCPLAGTSTIWDRSNLSQGETTFGVAGLLHNNNLMMYDRATESVWSQVQGKGVYGPERGTRAEYFPMIETSWETWLKIVREPVVLSNETGVNFDYSEDEFEYYKSVDDEIYYPLDYLDARIPFKERVHCIIVGDIAKAYRFEDFQL